mmetsp:Transcript_42643/g.78835  ORF Transcript_42643/g.78835 Transcript_42643/m.78835 type:complete len:239 (+) Transcript_42643:475-1191(+)
MNWAGLKLGGIAPPAEGAALSAALGAEEEVALGGDGRGADGRWGGLAGEPGGLCPPPPPPVFLRNAGPAFLSARTRPSSALRSMATCSSMSAKVVPGGKFRSNSARSYWDRRWEGEDTGTGGAGAPPRCCPCCCCCWRCCCPWRCGCCPCCCGRRCCCPCPCPRCCCPWRCSPCPICCPRCPCDGGGTGSGAVVMYRPPPDVTVLALPPLDNGGADGRVVVFWKGLFGGMPPPAPLWL